MINAGAITPAEQFRDEQDIGRLERQLAARKLRMQKTVRQVIQEAVEVWANDGDEDSSEEAAILAALDRHGMASLTSPCRERDEQNPKDIAGSRKPPLDLIPPVANVYESLVLKHGADKYEAFNWREGPKINERVYAAAALRHLAAIIDGEYLDDDSGLPHWAHVRATAGIVLDAHSLGQLQDNSIPVGAGPAVMKELTLPDPSEIE